MPRRSGARSATSSTRTPPRRVYAKGLASLDLGLPPLGEGAHALLQVLALRHQGLRQRLLLEAGLEAALVGALEEALREAERERRPAREALAPAARRRLQVRARHDLVAEPEAERLVGGDVVGEEDQLLRLEQPDQAREEERAARVDGDAAPREHLDETRLGRHDDEVAGECQVRAHPGGDAVDGRDDRLLEIQHGADQALRVLLHDRPRRARNVADRPLPRQARQAWTSASARRGRRGGGRLPGHGSRDALWPSLSDSRDTGASAPRRSLPVGSLPRWS